jgi:hypothetical protein
MLTKPFNIEQLWKGKMASQGPCKLNIQNTTLRTTEFNSYRICPLQYSVLDNYQKFSDLYWEGVRKRNKIYRDTNRR